MDIARSLRPLGAALAVALAGAVTAQPAGPLAPTLPPVAAPPAAAPQPAAPETTVAAPAEDEGRERVKTTSGKIARIDRAKPELVVDTAEGPVALSFDRNTTVFLDRHIGTLRDLDAGTPVRAGYDIARKRAHWIEIRKVAAEPAPPPAQAQPSGPSLPPPPGSENVAGTPDEKGTGDAPGNERPPTSTAPPQPPDGGMPPLSPGPGRGTPGPMVPR